MSSEAIYIVEGEERALVIDAGTNIKDFDKEAGYGFSGDAFGSGYLLLITNFTTLKYTCMRTLEYMQKNNIKMMYPGHYNESALK